MARTFECSGDGLVCERYEDGSVSFDIFDGRDWPGGEKEGKELAKFIVDSMNDSSNMMEILLDLEERLGEARTVMANSAWAVSELPNQEDLQEVIRQCRQKDKEKANKP